MLKVSTNNIDEIALRLLSRIEERKELENLDQYSRIEFKVQRESDSGFIRLLAQRAFRSTFIKGHRQ